MATNTATNPPAAHAPATSTTGKTFQINNSKLYVPAVTLSVNDNIKFLDNRKFLVSRHKYRTNNNTAQKRQFTLFN